MGGGLHVGTLYYGVTKTFSKSHELESSPRRLNEVLGNLITEVQDFCKNRVDIVSCSPRNFGYLNNPKTGPINPHYIFH